jgi:hypothetical protein
MIEKKVIINLTQEEIDSPEDIQVTLTVNGPGGEEDGVDYVFTYPKEKPKSLPPLEDIIGRK